MSFTFTTFREMDKLGRIVIPMTIRKKIGINPGDELKISVDDGIIIMSKAENACIFCGSCNDVIDFSGKSVCTNCIEKLSEQTVVL